MVSGQESKHHHKRFEGLGHKLPEEVKNEILEFLKKQISKNQNKLRLGYGQFHQSNNAWIQPNPGYDGNGFSINDSVFWK